MHQPIRRQLLTPLLTVLVIAVVGMAACAAWLNWSRQAAQLRERQAGVIRVLDDAAFPLTAAVLQQMARLSGQQFVVWDSTTATVAESSLIIEPAQRRELARNIAFWMTAGQAGEPIVWGGESFAVRASRLRRQPELQVLVLTSQRSLAEARWDALWPPLALGGVALLLLIPWLLQLTQGWSARIKAIQRSVADIARGQATSATMPTGRDDELAALVADVQQLSERLRALQAELIQSERERLVAQLASGFAHQFRNGVAGASLALQLHGQRCGAASDNSLAVAQKQLGLLEAEIRGILSLAKRAESPRSAVSVDELLADAIELVQPALEHHRIDLDHAATATGITLHGQRDGLRAAVLNLLLNAIDACGPGGQIRVTAHPDHDWVTISIWDNGPGPSPDVATRMTEAFVTTKPEGIGLGLTVVTAIAHDHHGQLTWRRDGQWTVVELRLPT